MKKCLGDKLLKIFVPGLLISVFLISGCGSKKNVSVKKKAKATSVSGKTISNATDEGNKTINDVNTWNSQIGEVLKNNNIKAVKVVLQNNTYPMIYVEFPYNIDGNHKNNFRELVKDLAKANEYGDYKIIDETNVIFLEVICDKEKKIVKEVKGGPNGYFSDMYPSQSNSGGNSKAPDLNTDLISYLEKNVPEVSTLRNSITTKSNSTVKLLIYVEREPNSASGDIYLRDYYGIYVGESHPDHSVNIYRFAVKKDTKEILFYDVVEDKYMTLDEWRKEKR